MSIENLKTYGTRLFFDFWFSAAAGGCCGGYCLSPQWLRNRPLQSLFGMLPAFSGLRLAAVPASATPAGWHADSPATRMTMRCNSPKVTYSG
jgi:hypothetical protein